MKAIVQAFAIFCIVNAGVLNAQTIDRPLRSVIDPGVITTRQTITPAGVPTIFKGKVWGVTFGKSTDELWVLTATQLYQMNWRGNQILANLALGSRPGLLGVTYSKDRVYVTAIPSQKKASLFTQRCLPLKRQRWFGKRVQTRRFFTLRSTLWKRSEASPKETVFTSFTTPLAKQPMKAV